MPASIHQLPRFKGEQPRQLPSGGTIEFPDALRIFATRHTEWVEHLAETLREGCYLKDEDDRDHVITDADLLDALHTDLKQVAAHLFAMADQLEPPDGRK